MLGSSGEYLGKQNWSFAVAPWVKDPVLLLLWLRFSPLVQELPCNRRGQKKKEKKQNCSELGADKKQGQLDDVAS